MHTSKTIFNPFRIATIKIIVLFAILLSFQKAHSQDFDTKAKMKAIYIYNFATYTQWPEASKKGNFVIGIYGDYPAIVDFFKNLAKTNKVGLQNIEIKKYQTLPEIQNSHILFVINEKSNQLPDIIKKMNGENTLLITDKKGLGKVGAGISFFAEANTQKFELNKMNIEKYGLKVSSNLLKLTDVLY